MGERYTRLFSLPENLYSTGAPVIIAAGALLKDNQTGNVLAQLKLRSISSKTIKAATVSIKPLDTAGLSLGNSVTYQYLDLQADRDTDFGQKTAIPLTNPATRSFGVIVSEVIFTDNSIWHGDDQPWEALTEPTDIDFLGDKELTKQFRMEYGADCKNLLLEQKDLWHCVCGAINHQAEACCHSCRRVLSELNAIDMGDLQKREEMRLVREQTKLETERAKTQKIRKIATIVVPLLVIVIIATSVISGRIKKNNIYNGALELLENGQYEKAIDEFSRLGEYKECAAKIKYAEQEKAYCDAIALLESKQFTKAIESFENMNGYKNSAQMILETKYQWALSCLDIGNDHMGYELFLELSNIDYKDAGTYLEDFCYLPSSVSINGSEKYICDYDTHGNVIKGLLKLVPDYSIFFDERSYVFPGAVYYWPVFDEVCYSYNDDNSYSYTCSHQFSSWTENYVFEFDSKGQCTSKTQYRSYNSEPYEFKNEYKFEYYYNSQCRKETHLLNNRIEWVLEFAENGVFDIGSNEKFKIGAIDKHNNIIVDGKGNRFTYNYDDYGRLTHRELPAYNNMYTDFFYDKNGYLIEQTGVDVTGREWSDNFVYEYDWFYCPDADRI